MSSVIVAGNTSGSITLQAPDVAGTTVLNLPATSGTIITTGGGSPGSFTSITDSGLTSGRVTYATTGGELTDSANLVWDNTNARLGIGTSSPANKLDVQINGAGTATAIALSSTITSGLYVRKIALISAGGTAQQSIDFAFTDRSSNNAGYITFNTTLDNANPNLERMRIDSDGNVGIGLIPTAGTKLEVSGGITSYGPETTGAAGTGGSISFVGNDGTALGRLWGYVAGYKENSTVGNVASYMSFATRASGSGAAEKMRLDSSGNLGLGVTPQSWYANTWAIELGNRYASIYSGSGQSGSPNIIMATNSYSKTATGLDTYIATAAASKYVQSNANHIWYNAPSGSAGTSITFTQAMTLDVNGNLLVGTTTATSGGASLQTADGITFPATWVVSTNANTLDDYEEGSFTPTISGSTTAGTGTYGARTGVYTKIGNILYFYAYINWSAHTGTGNLLLSALPFTSSSTSNLAPVVNIVGSSLTFANQLYANISGSSTQVDLRTMSTGAATAAVAMDTAATIVVTGFYYVA